MVTDMDPAPLLDSRGRRRSIITLSEYRRGKPAPNKGMKLPAEILTQDEVAAVLDSVSSKTAIGKRNRAMVALMYRAEVKVGQIVALAYRHYDRETAVLTVPGIRGTPDRAVRLDSQARQFLEDWLDVRGTLRLRATAPLFCTVSPPRGGPMRTAQIRETLTNKARRLGIQKRVTYQKWSDAHQLLETAPDRYASTIGHLCREAIIEFSDELAHRAGVGSFEPMQTKAKVRAVFASRSEISTSVRRSLEALVSYWESVSDLVQRQEHGSKLVAEDSRRLVFQTMLVMREIDLALSRND
jgi:Phage integrase family